MQIILINGAPRSGKDTLGTAIVNHCADRGLNACVTKFAWEVKIKVHGIFDAVDELGKPLPADWFENVKDSEGPSGTRMTWRQAYIWYSEEVMKPKFGSTFFGRKMADRLKATMALGKYDVVAITDCGFFDEVDQVVRQLWEPSMRLVRVTRPGCTYMGDSRGPVTHDRVPLHIVVNDGTADDLATVTAELVS